MGGSEGQEGDEDREPRCEGDEGSEGQEGDEAREPPCEGDEGSEGQEGDEAREPPCEGDEGCEGAEGHEVSWGMSTPGEVRDFGPLVVVPAPTCGCLRTVVERGRARG